MKQTFKDFLINEGRGAPRGINYSFDDIDASVDKNSFRDSNKARRVNKREDDYNREMGFRDAELERTRSGRFQGMDDEERMEYQMMHGTEEVEQLQKQKYPASMDKQKSYQGKRNRSGAPWSAYPSTKRQGQQAARNLRSLKGSGNPKGMRHGEDEMESKMIFNAEKMTHATCQHHRLNVQLNAQKEICVDNTGVVTKAKMQKVLDWVKVTIQMI